MGHPTTLTVANIDPLRGLPAEAGSHKAHDLGHVRQVAERVRRRKYLAGAGPLGEEYLLEA